MNRSPGVMSGFFFYREMPDFLVYLLPEVPASYKSYQLFFKTNQTFILTKAGSFFNIILAQSNLNHTPMTFFKGIRSWTNNLHRP
jgi:hypothetical protein